MRQYAFDDHIDASGVRMNTIPLIQMGNSGHAVQKKWIQGDCVFFREPRINPIEFGPVFPAQIGRRKHPRQQYAKATGRGFFNNRVQISLGRGRVEPAQPVISAQFDNQYMRRFSVLGCQRPVQPRQSACAGIPRYPCVFDGCLNTRTNQRRLQAFGEGCRARQTVSSR